MGIAIIDESKFLEIASVAGMTLEQGQEKVSALAKGEIRSGDTRETENIGVCPHCNSIIIPMPKKARKCPECDQSVIPLGGQLVSAKGIVIQLSGHRKALVVLMVAALRELLCDATKEEMKTLKELLDLSIDEINKANRKQN